VNAGKDALLASFDGGWTHRREADAHTAVLILHDYSEDYERKPVIGWRHLYSVRECKFTRDGITTTLTLRAPNYFGSAKGMENVGLEDLIDHVKSIIEKFGLFLDLVLDGDLCNKSSAALSSIVRNRYLDGGHKKKSVKKVMEKSEEFQHFTAVVVKWFGTCLALAKKGEIDEKQTLQMFHNCANHLQDHHSACPSDSPCHSDTFHLKLPNLVQADQGRIGRFRELLEKCYSSQPSGDKIACPGDTTPNEAYHNHATVFSPKAEDFPVSGPLRAALSALTHNVGIVETVRILFKIGSVPLAPNVLAAIQEIERAQSKKNMRNRQLWAAEKAEREQGVLFRREARLPFPWHYSP